MHALCRRRTVVRLAVALVGAVLLPACQCGEGPPAPPHGDVFELEAFDSTRILAEDELTTLTAFEDDGTLRFAGTPSSLAVLEELDVIVGGATPVAPAGLLRLVTSWEEGADGLVVHTREAPIQMAFSRLEVRHTATTESDAPATHLSRTNQALTIPGGGGSTFSIHDPLFDVDGDDTSPDDQVFADGTLHGGLDYVFSISFDWASVSNGIDAFKECLKEALTGNFSCSPEDFLPEVKTGLSFSAGADAHLDVEGVAFLGYDSTFPFYTQQLPLITLYPLVFVPTLTVEAHFHGEATSQFSYEVNAAATASGGVSVSNKGKFDLDGPDFDYEFSAVDVDALLGADASVTVGPELTVLLYGMIGPSAALLVGARLAIDRDETPCYRLYGNVTGNVGVYVGFKDLPGFTLIHEKVPFSLVETEIDSGACVPLPNNGAPGPTAGDPDLAAFQSPQFSPWARAYAGIVDGHPVEGPGAQVEWSALTPTIDGKLWVVGSDVDALTAIDTDGSVLWAKRYTADVPFWPDLGTPKLLVSRAAPMDDATMLVAAYPYTLLRLDVNGNVLASERFMHEPFKETWLRFTDLKKFDDGFFLVGHVGDSYSEGYLHDIWVQRLDRFGDVVWSRRISDPTWQLSARIAVPFEDGVVLVGDMYNTAGSLVRGLVVRVDADGDVVWSQSVVADDCGQGYEQRLWLTAAQRTTEGDVLVGGGVLMNGNEAAVARIKPDGALPSFATLRASDDAHLGPTLTALVQLPTSGFLVAGTYSGAQTADDWFLAGLDAAGGVQWARVAGGHDNPVDTLRDGDTYPTLLLTKDGGAVVAGFTESITATPGVWTLKAPARSGALAIGSALASTGPLTLTSGEACLTGVAHAVTVSDDAIAAREPMTVFVEEVAVDALDLEGAAAP